MLRSWFVVPVLAAVCCLALSAADYYARVPLNSPAYTDLTALNQAGLLPEWQGPKYALLRLEIAMLLQSALPKYYDQLDGGTIPAANTESALKRLTKEYHEELDGLGVEVRDPLTAHAPGPHQPAAASSPSNSTAGEPDTLALDKSTAIPIPPEALPPGEVMLEVQQGADEAPTPAGAPEWNEAASLPADEQPQAVRPPSPAKPAKPSTPPLSKPAAAPAPVKSAAPAVRPPAVTTPPSASPVMAPRPVPSQLSDTPLVPSGGEMRGMADDRDVNLLLDRRNAELGSTTAASVEHTDRIREHPVEDEVLAPGPVHFEDLPRDVKVVGDLRGQAYWRDTRQPLGQSSAAGLRLYWGDMGVDYAHQQWSARVKFNYNDDVRTPKLHELWAKYQNADGVYAQAGRVILPFANRTGDFPTFSAARQLGFTNANAAGIGWNKPDWGASVWVYDPGTSAASGTTNLREFALSLNLFQADCDDASNGWRVALAYLSELGGATHKLAGGPLTASVPGLNLSGGYDWGCGQYHVNFDYTGATRRFAAADLDANGDGLGDRPQALNLELLFTPDHATLYGARYEHTNGYSGAAANRLAAMYGRWLSDQLLARLELSRGQYNDYTPGKRHDIGVTVDARLVF